MNKKSTKATYALSSGAYSHKIEYSIENKSIAPIDSNGYITGIKCVKAN